MASKNINKDMSVYNIIDNMSEGNPGAIECIIGLMENSKKWIWLEYMETLDKFEIYGSKIYMIWNDSCQKDMNMFIKTIKAFQQGMFTKEEIQENLSKGYAEPFIEEDEEVEE